jgi:hypothetical protein
MYQVASHRTTTGTSVAAATGFVFVLRAVAWAHAGTGGSFILKDGGASGTTKLTIDTPAAAGSHLMTIPGSGILFGTDIHATLDDVDGITVIYEKRIAS